MDAQHVRKQTTISIDGLDRTLLMYTIRGYYRYGIDELILQFSKPTVNYGRSTTQQPVKKIVQTELTRLMGFEVVHEAKDYITIRCVQQPTANDFDAILRRIFLLIKLASQALERPMTTATLADVEQTHDQVTKFVSYCLRVLNTSHYPDFHKTTYYYHTVGSLDRIMDFIKYAAREIKIKKLSDSAMLHIKKINKTISDFYDFFFTFTLQTATRLNEQRYVIESELSKSEMLAKDMMICAKYSAVTELILDLIEARMALENKDLQKLN